MSVGRCGGDGQDEAAGRAGDCGATVFFGRGIVMVKNVVIVLLLAAVCVFVTLLVSGRLEWVSEEELAARTPEAVLAEAIEMLRPQVISLDGQELLCAPKAELSGKNWRVHHLLYIYEDGELKPLHLR